MAVTGPATRKVYNARQTGNLRNESHHQGHRLNRPPLGIGAGAQGFTADEGDKESGAFTDQITEITDKEDNRTMTQFPYIDALPLEAFPKDIRESILQKAQKIVDRNNDRLEKLGLDEKNMTLREAVELVLFFANNLQTVNGDWILLPSALKKAEEK